MKSKNSLNPKIGRDFEKLVKKVLERKYQTKFSEQPFNIGNPPKEHYFDLVSEDRNIIVECKNYSWTKACNVPSAKMAFISEAILLLSYTPKDIEKMIILRRDVSGKSGESLAEYYYRTHKHLLNDIKLMELDIDNLKLKEIGCDFL